MRFFYILSLVFTAFLACDVEACWFSSKSRAIKHIDEYMHKIGRDPEEGLTRKDFDDIIRDIPSSIRWAVNKLGNIQGVFDRCDYDKDGKIKLSEAKKSKHCIKTCWKQMAIESFL